RADGQRATPYVHWWSPPSTHGSPPSAATQLPAAGGSPRPPGPGRPRRTVAGRPGILPAQLRIPGGRSFIVTRQDFRRALGVREDVVDLFELRDQHRQPD